MKKLCVALIGGIGCGKTTISGMFKALGVDIISADDIARELTHQNKIKDALKSTFGPNIFNDNNELNRKKLSILIFSDPCKKKKLEALLHPPIRSEIVKQIKNSNGSYCLIELPVFKNRDEYSYINRVLFVKTPLEKQISQTILRDKKTKKAIDNIISQQESSETQYSLTDDYIDNSSTLEALENKCKKMHEYYLTLI